MNSAQDPAQSRSPDPAELRAIPIWLRWTVGLLGVALLALGAIAVFFTANGTGSAALVTAGAVLVGLSVLAERLEGVELAGLKMGLKAASKASEKERAAIAADRSGDHAQAS